MSNSPQNQSPEMRIELGDLIAAAKLPVIEPRAGESAEDYKERLSEVAHELIVAVVKIVRAANADTGGSIRDTLNAVESELHANSDDAPAIPAS